MPTHAKKIKRGCKWCKAPFESLVTDEKTVKIFEGRKEIKPPKGYKNVARIVTCSECGQMVRCYGPKLVEARK